MRHLIPIQNIGGTNWEAYIKERDSNGNMIVFTGVSFVYRRIGLTNK